MTIMTLAEYQQHKAGQDAKKKCKAAVRAGKAKSARRSKKLRKKTWGF